MEGSFDGGLKHLQNCMFDGDFYLQQVRILHLDKKKMFLREEKGTNMAKRVFWPAFRCCKHPEACQNTQPFCCLFGRF